MISTPRPDTPQPRMIAGRQQLEVPGTVIAVYIDNTYGADREQFVLSMGRPDGVRTYLSRGDIAALAEVLQNPDGWPRRILWAE